MNVLIEVNNMEDKIFFSPGDVVTIRQNIPNKPTMLVDRKVNNMISKDDKEGILRGIRCRWFTKDGHMEEGVFNTKDLELVKQ